MIMWAKITGITIECVYAAETEGCTEVTMPDGWRDYHITFQNGTVVLGDKIIDNSPPLT